MIASIGLPNLKGVPARTSRALLRGIDDDDDRQRAHAIGVEERESLGTYLKRRASAFPLLEKESKLRDARCFTQVLDLFLREQPLAKQVTLLPDERAILCLIALVPLSHHFKRDTIPIPVTHQVSG